MSKVFVVVREGEVVAVCSTLGRAYDKLRKLIAKHFLSTHAPAPAYRPPYEVETWNVDGAREGECVAMTIQEVAKRNPEVQQQIEERAKSVPLRAEILEHRLTAINKAVAERRKLDNDMMTYKLTFAEYEQAVDKLNESNCAK